MSDRGNGDAHAPREISAIEALAQRTEWLEQGASAQRESIEWLVAQVRLERDDIATLASVLTRVDQAVAQLAQQVSRFRAEVIARLGQMGGGG